MRLPPYDQCVFINCPFDGEYKTIFDALVFTVKRCGFFPRCALETQDGSQTRIDKILAIVSGCRFAIHDISRTELDASTQLPRFNMPLELGIFLGAKYFGDKRQRTKSCLVLDREKFRYQQYCSDISGQDIEAHAGDPKTAVSNVRDWLRTQKSQMMNSTTLQILPSGSDLFKDYERFRADLPAICLERRLVEAELVFADTTALTEIWMMAQGP
jgi:hypothetical protein